MVKTEKTCLNIIHHTQPRSNAFQQFYCRLIIIIDNRTPELDKISQQVHSWRRGRVHWPLERRKRKFVNSCLESWLEFLVNEWIETTKIKKNKAVTVFSSKRDNSCFSDLSEYTSYCAPLKKVVNSDKIIELNCGFYTRRDYKEAELIVTEKF